MTVATRDNTLIVLTNLQGVGNSVYQFAFSNLRGSLLIKSSENVEAVYLTPVVEYVSALWHTQSSGLCVHT